MTLSDYLDSRKGELTLSAMAAAVKTSVGRLSQVKSGDPCSARLALAIEGFSGGAVDAAMLSRDVAITRKQAAA